MFEKEAKEYATRPVLYGTHTWKDEEKAFKDGAEFGYNKANEWHKVTEKLPEHENLVCNQDGEPCWYDSETDQWLDVEGTRTKTIEWCDMPTKEIE